MNDYFVGLLLFGLGLLVFIFSVSYLMKRDEYCKTVEREYQRIKNQDYQIHNIKLT